MATAKDIEFYDTAGDGDLADFIDNIFVQANAKIGDVNAFLDAAIDGNLKAVKSYLKAGIINVDATNRMNTTALWYAAKHGHSKVVEVLLAAGADPDFRSSRNDSPLGAAAYNGHRRVAKSLIQALKEKCKNKPKAFYEAISFTANDGYSVLRNAQNGNIDDLIRSEIDAAKQNLPHENIVIVGGGFSGTLAAINLLNQSDNDEFIRIILVERNEGSKGGGLAYGSDTTNNEHVLNISADRASLDPDDLEDFTSWLEDNHVDIYRNSHDSVPRRVYREYLNQRLDEANQQLQDAVADNHNVSLVRKSGEVIDIEKQAIGGKVLLDTGETIDAAHVIIASGHTGTVQPGFFDKVNSDDRVLLSQWGQAGRRFMNKIKPQESVFIVGSSLSAKDVVVSLKKRGHQGQIVMMSRHGYVHPTYEPNRSPEQITLEQPRFLDDIKTTETIRAVGGRFAGSRRLSEDEIIDGFVRGLQTEWFGLTRQGRYNGEQILSNWERYIPNAVQSLLDAGVSKETIAQRFHQHKSLISTTRVGASRAIGEVVHQAKISGQLQIWAGHIEDVTPEKKGVRVNYRFSVADGTSVRNSKTFDYVISSLGQEMDYRKVVDTLWQNLIGKGMVTPHWTHIGIDVDEDGRVIDSEGNSSDFITAVGTMRSGDTTVRRRSYSEKRGSGGRLSPFNHNIVGIRDQFRVAHARQILSEVRNTATARENAAVQQPQDVPIAAVA